MRYFTINKYNECWLIIMLYFKVYVFYYFLLIVFEDVKWILRVFVYIIYKLVRKWDYYIFII